jgi:hypothetical protein
MSFPSSPHPAIGHPISGVSPTSPSRPVTRQATNGLPRSGACSPLPVEGEHQLEKLEFALAIALTRGDTLRSRQLREEIDKLGGNQEEPGT